MMKRKMDVVKEVRDEVLEANRGKFFFILHLLQVLYHIKHVFDSSYIIFLLFLTMI